MCDEFRKRQRVLIARVSFFLSDLDLEIHLGKNILITGNTGTFTELAKPYLCDLNLPVMCIRNRK